MDEQNMTYSLIDHTSDLGILVRGHDPSQLFANAALALFDIIAGGSHIECRAELTLEISGNDWADLMINWLRELLYLWNGKRRLVHSLKILSLAEYSLTAVLRYDLYAPERHTVNREIKAVTYHRVKVGPVSNGWTGEIIFDV